MTIYGWDSSHYDLLTAAAAKAAAVQGIVFATHKIGEGTGDDDPKAAGALAALRDAGIPVLGGYWFCHDGDDASAEADRLVARTTVIAPWWEDFPAWFWQADSETEAGASGKPSKAWLQTFCDRLVSTTGRKAIVYASHGEYGDSLDGLTHPLWNANYPSSRKASFASLYPGDSYSGWTKYSGQVPVFAQFSSSATIGGLTTCDANAFRGTLDDLLALIGDTAMPLSAGDVKTILTTDNAGLVNPSFRPDSPTFVPPPKVPNPQITVATALEAAMTEANAAHVQSAANGALLAGIVKTEAAIQATLNTLTTGGTDIDTAALSAQIKAVGDTETAQVTALQQALAVASTRIAQLEAAVAAGANAEATALKQ